MSVGPYSEPQELSGAAIAGIVIGGVAAAVITVAVLALLSILCCR